MATAVAHKLEFPAEIDTHSPVKAATREEALALMGAGRNATHEQGVDANVHYAANGMVQLHRAGRRIDIEASGYPYDVLENVATRLQSVGASQYMTEQVMTALQDYILNMGSDFSRAAKAKPLHARIMVTDRKPDDLPECEQEQAVFLDGIRKIGGEAARINVQNTVFGTKSTTSQGVDLNTLFASKKDGLFIYFGALVNEGIGGFDSVDSALVDLAQGMGADIGGAGGGPAKQAVEEIKQAIKAGDATPETLKLVENLARLSQIADAMKTPGAVTNAPAKMTETVRAITQQIQSGVTQGVIPGAVIQGAATVITHMQNNEVVQAVLASPEGAQALMTAAGNDAGAPPVAAILSQEPAAVPADADNDNVAVVAQVQAVTAQLAELAAADSTPPEIRAQLQAQIAVLAQSADAPHSLPVQAALSTVAQTLTTIDAPAADTVAAKVETLSAQLTQGAAVATPAIQALDTPAAATTVTPVTAVDGVPALPETAARAAADIKEVVAALQKAEALPPALAAAVAKIDLPAATPGAIAAALQGRGETAPAVQAVVMALADPAVRAQLPAETLSSVLPVIARQPDLAPAVAAQIVVQSLQAATAAMKADTPQLQTVTEIVRDLSTGARTVATLPAAAVAAVSAALPVNHPVAATALRILAQPPALAGGGADKAAVASVPAAGSAHSATPAGVKREGAAPVAAVAALRGVVPVMDAASSVTTTAAAPAGTTISSAAVRSVQQPQHQQQHKQQSTAAAVKGAAAVTGKAQPTADGQAQASAKPAGKTPVQKAQQEQAPAAPAARKSVPATTPDGASRDANAAQDSGKPRTIYETANQNNGQAAAVNAALAQAEQAMAAQLRQHQEQMRQLAQQQAQQGLQKQNPWEDAWKKQAGFADTVKTDPFGFTFAKNDSVFTFGGGGGGSGGGFDAFGDSPKEEISFSSPCGGCKGGSCATCRSAFSDSASTTAKASDVVEKRLLASSPGDPNLKIG